MERLRQAVAALAAAHPEVQRALQFGSLARDQATPASDADLLVVLDTGTLPFRHRIPYYTPTGCGIGVDVFPYTRSEMEALAHQPGSIVGTALREGIELYRRAEGPQEK